MLNIIVLWGYNARVMSYDELHEAQRKEDEMMMQAIAMVCGEWRGEWRDED